jgi:hypothetical protein
MCEMSEEIALLKSDVASLEEKLEDKDIGWISASAFLPEHGARCIWEFPEDKTSNYLIGYVECLKSSGETIPYVISDLPFPRNLEDATRWCYLEDILVALENAK